MLISTKHIYILPKSLYSSTGEYGGLIDYIEHYLCFDCIEDYIDDDKDVMMELTLCIDRDIVFTTHIINAFAPKQVHLGLDSSPEYRILVC